MPLEKAIEKDLIKKLPRLLENVQVVSISDYNKGFLSKEFLKEIITLSNEKNIPCIIDPKGLNFSKYKNATILKPNLIEAYSACNLSYKHPLEKVAKYLKKITNIKNLIITKSEDGITVFDENMQRKDFPVLLKEVKDVTGAGDTVLATLVVCVGNKFPIAQSVSIANISAGIAIEHIGCMIVKVEDIAERL